MSGRTPVGRLTARDYKKGSRRPLELTRWREFGAGLLAGVALAAVLFSYGRHPERPGVYVLQAGSYRNEADAERVAKQLSLQGIDAKVQRVAVDADVWHRVRVGPINDLAQLNRVRKQLHAADVDAIVIRIGD